MQKYQIIIPVKILNMGFAAAKKTFDGLYTKAKQVICLPETHQQLAQHINALQQQQE